MIGDVKTKKYTLLKEGRQKASGFQFTCLRHNGKYRGLDRTVAKADILSVNSSM